MNLVLRQRQSQGKARRPSANNDDLRLIHQFPAFCDETSKTWRFDVQLVLATDSYENDKLYECWQLSHYRQKSRSDPGALIRDMRSLGIKAYVTPSIISVRATRLDIPCFNQSEFLHE